LDSKKTLHACRLCGSERVHELVRYNAIVVARCSSCRSGFIVDPKSKKTEELSSYSSSYEEEQRSGKAKVCWKLFCKLTDGLAGTRNILDAGCGEGKFLDLAQAAGLETAGVEIVPHAASIAESKGHVIFSCPIGDDSIHGPPFYDMVTMWDILEHLCNPAEALKRVYQTLKPGGKLIIVTPMMDSIYDRLGLLLYKITQGRFDKILRMCWNRQHLFRYHQFGIGKALQQIGFTRVNSSPILLLSLTPEHYAGGNILESWTKRQWLNRIISRMGVLCCNLLHLRNKLIITAIKGT